MGNTVKERLKEIIKDYGIKDSDFCREIGVSQGFISGMRKSIQPNKIERIAEIYPTWNTEWILTGKGDMYKQEKPLNHGLGRTIKYYPTVNGTMGGIQFLDNPDESFVDIIIPGFSDCEFAINAYGDSMYPVIKSGQVVLLMPWREKFIEWGRIYLVVTKSGYRTIKYIKPSKNDGCVLCESENKEESPAFEIEKDDILKMYLVKGWICKDAI